MHSLGFLLNCEYSDSGENSLLVIYTERWKVLHNCIIIFFDKLKLVSVCYTKLDIWKDPDSYQKLPFHIMAVAV